MRVPRLATAVGIVFSWWIHATTIALAARLCIVPVPLGAPDKCYGPGNPPLIMVARSFPGSRWPTFTSWGACGRTFVLNDKDKLEVPHGFAIGLYDTYVTEPSGRVVGLWPVHGRAQLYIQDPATGRFVGVNGSDVKTIGTVSRAAWISGRHATLVATSTGVFSLAGDPIPKVSRLDLTGAAIGEVNWVSDLPLHHAAAIGTNGGSAFILNPDNSVREVPGLPIPSRNWGTRFSEIGNPDRLLIEANEELWTAPLRRDGNATLADRAHRITSYVFDGNVLQYHPAIGQYLVYAKRDSWLSSPRSLFRLADELTPIGGSAGLDHPFIRDIPSRGIVTVETFNSGIFTYDGKGALKPIPRSAAADIGVHPKVYELTGQNKVVVLTISGLYELTAPGGLDRLPLPSELEGAEFDQLAELPASHVAVLFANRGAFELDPAGRLSRIPGGEGVDFGIAGVDVVERIPIRETLFVSTYHGGSFMILDQDKVGPGACAAGHDGN